MSPNIAIDQRTPIDYIEPELDMRHASLGYIRVLDAFAMHMGEALKTGNSGTVNTAFWGAVYGLGLSVCGGVTMTKCASHLGVTRATISKTAQSFVTKAGLPPSFYMKSAASHQPYRLARKGYIANGSHKKFEV